MSCHGADNVITSCVAPGVSCHGAGNVITSYVAPVVCCQGAGKLIISHVAPQQPRRGQRKQSISGRRTLRCRVADRLWGFRYFIRFGCITLFGLSVFHLLLTLHTTYAAWGSEFVDPSSHTVQEHCKLCVLKTLFTFHRAYTISSRDNLDQLRIVPSGSPVATQPHKQHAIPLFV